MPETPHRSQREWPAPGWYPDPADGAGERYWNGFAWDLGDLKAEPHRDWSNASPLPTVIDHEAGPEYSTGSQLAMVALWLVVIAVMVLLSLVGGWYGFILAGFVGAVASVYSLRQRQRTRRGMGLVPLVSAAAVILLAVGIPAVIVDNGSVGMNTQFIAVAPPTEQAVAPVTALPTAAATPQTVVKPEPAPAPRITPVPVSSQDLAGAYPPGVTAVCADGHFSTEGSASTACATDGGVTHWINGAPAVAGSDSSTVYYANCDAVRAAGKAPLSAGEPGYAPKLDRDRDGIACE